MTPFTVTCETCRARLKVRDAAAIGEIHSCPKCGSMVQIAPPMGWNPAEQAAPSTVAVSANACVAATSDVSFAQITEPSEQAADAFAAAAAIAACPSFEPVIPPDPAVDPIAPAEVAKSIAPSASVSSKLLLWGGIGAAVLVVGGLAIVILRGDSPTEIAAVPHAAAAESNPAESPLAIVEPVAPTREPADDAPSADESVRVAQKPVIELPSAPDTAAGNENLPFDVPRQNEPAAVPNSVATEAAQSEVTSSASEELPPAPPPVAAGSESARPAVLRLDPLDFDPAQLSLNATAIPAKNETSASIAATATDLSANPAEELTAEPPAADAVPPPAENPSVTVKLGPIAPVDANPRAAARQLALPVESLSIRDMPLAQFVAIVCDMSGVSITLDPVALQLAGVSPHASVTVDASGATLEKLLRDALAKHRLELLDRDGHMTTALAKSGERSVKRYDVADLLSPGAADASEVASMVRQFVAPPTWQNAAGGTIAVEGTKLRVEQTKVVHHELLIFCERLRLARGLKQRSQYPASRLATGSPYAEIETKLGQTTTFTFLPWTRLDDVVHHWEQSTGLTILVDWNQLAAVELAPATPIACSAIDRRWDEAIAEIFEPLGLAWWAVDGDTIQITTSEELKNIERTEFYTIPAAMREQFTSSAVFIESLQTVLQQQLGDRGVATDQLHMQLDAPSGRLIVRGPLLVRHYLAERLKDAAR